MPYSDLDRAKGAFIPWPLVLLVLIVGGMFWFAIWAASKAQAHEWYPISCCSGADCRPAEEGEIRAVPGGVQIKGHGFVRSDDSRMQLSQDARFHLCEPAGKFGCIFSPPGGV